MVIVSFYVQDKFEKTRFFCETFLVTYTSVEVVFEISFLTFSIVQVNFTERELTWKAYTIVEVLPTIKKVQIIDLKDFAKAVLDPE